MCFFEIYKNSRILQSVTKLLYVHYFRISLPFKIFKVIVKKETEIQALFQVFNSYKFNWRL